VLAVDFGTSTTSAAMRVAGGLATKVKLDMAGDAMPSAVAYPDDNPRAGQSALHCRRSYPEVFVASPKACLGRGPVLLDGQKVPAPQVASHVLAAVRDRALAAAGGSTPATLVLTHPGWWAAGQLADLREAAVLAGFDAQTVRTVPASLAAGHALVSARLAPGTRVVVVDVGGGICDVAVLEVGDRGQAPLTVVANAGDDRLGGNTLDDLVFAALVARLAEDGRSDLADALAAPENRGEALVVLDAVRTARQVLSDYCDTTVVVAAGGLEATVALTRAEYESLVAGPVAQISALVAQTVAQAGPGGPAGVYLTGGAGYTPVLMQAMAQVSDSLTFPSGDPKLAAALGALAVWPTADAARTGPRAGLPRDGQGQVLTDQPTVGDVLAGRYELLTQVGHGGMGVVWRAYDQRLHRDVAVKVLFGNLAGDAAARDRFRREALTSGKLDHPCVVDVIDTNAADDTGPRYIAMRYVEGTSLDHMIAAGPLPVRQAVRIVADVASALAHAHAKGVVHRDIKPGNVMVTPDGQVKVVDFGIARVMSSAALSHELLGTANYLAPERARGGHVDGRADIYSTGCMLFEALTGRPPFVSEDTFAVVTSHIEAVPPRPSMLRAGVPPALDAIVACTLAKDPADRFPTAADLRTALDRVVV